MFYRRCQANKGEILKITFEAEAWELAYLREQNRNNTKTNKNAGAIAQVYFACMQPLLESVTPPSRKIIRPAPRAAHYLTK